MKLDGKLNYQELCQLVVEWSPLIIGNYIKKIYHWEGLWMFKFKDFSFVLEQGIALWPGTFDSRETNIHSICIKLRNEIMDKRLTEFFINKEDRTIVMKFNNEYSLVFEIFAKGNLILLDKEQKIVVLTRPNSFTSHHDFYPLEPVVVEAAFNHFMWKKENYEVTQGDDTNPEAKFTPFLETLWNLKKLKVKKVITVTKPKVKYTKEDNIHHQIKKLNQSIDALQQKVDLEEEKPTIDYQAVGKMYQQIKLYKNKLKGARDALGIKIVHKKVSKNPKVTLLTNKWYHEYYWWYSSNGILVVGGKSADQNEKLVKTYMKDHHIYFHSDEPGSGSFIYFLEYNSLLQDKEAIETAQGVLSLSQNWKNNRIGKVYHVKGNQVSKTAPTGEFLGKGSFMVRGDRQYISVHQLCLGYCIKDNELMLGPYTLIMKQKTKCLKLQPKDVKKNSHKDLVKHIIGHLGVDKIPENIGLFPYACLISKNDFK